MKKIKGGITKLTNCALLSFSLLLVQPALEADVLGDRIDKIMSLSVDQDYAAYLAEACISCHQSEQGTGTPVIEGMAKQRIVISLLLYQNGSRINATMNSIASGLGDEEVAALAKYFSQMVDSK